LPSKLCSLTFSSSRCFLPLQCGAPLRRMATQTDFKDTLKVANQALLTKEGQAIDVASLQAIRQLLDEKEKFIKSNVLLNHIYNVPVLSRKEPVRVAVTGAAGQIGYSLIFRIASGGLFGPNQPVHLSLLEVPQALSALKGVVMEIEDCAFPVLSGITATTYPEEAFEGAQFVFLVGASPRKNGQERSDLMKANAQIFQIQGRALDKSAQKKNLKVLVVGNPANTNALIAAHNAPSIDPKCFSAMTRLDHNRGLAQLSEKLNVKVGEISNFAIWGNHSSTQYPDISFAKMGGKPVKSLVDNTWVVSQFIPTVQQRGAAIIKARGLSSAASAASAAVDHMRDWELGTNDEWTSMAVLAEDPAQYGATPGLYYSFPVVCQDKDYKIVQGLSLDEFSSQKLKETDKELVAERDAVKDFLKK